MFHSRWKEVTKYGLGRASMDPKPGVASLLKTRDAEYEDLAWEMFDDMLMWAKELGRGHEDSLNEIASGVRSKYSYKMGELSGQRESLITQLENAFRDK